MNYIFTSCALNFLPAAKVLFRSASKYLPQSRKVLALVDRIPEGFDVSAEGADELFTLEDLRNEFSHLEAWIFRHNVMELSTAVKPFVLESLLSREDCESVFFFDCDCVLYSDLQKVFRAFEQSSILLTPHACLPHTRREWFFFEFGPLKVGVFNLGFLGVRNDETGHHLARWWKERLREYCLVDHELGVFTDQKWLNYVPCYFEDFTVLRQPTLNVARWNTFQRHLTGDPRKGVRVDGEPVDFIHFSGFYKVGGYVKGLYDARSEPYCRNIELLDGLSEWYESQLRADAEREICRAPWGYGTYSEGEEVTDPQRIFFRRNDRLALTYPDPFNTSTPHSFLRHYQACASGPATGDGHSDLQRRAETAEARARQLEERLHSIYRSRSWKLLGLFRKARRLLGRF